MSNYDLNPYSMLAIEDDTQADIVLMELKGLLDERDRLIGIVENEIGQLRNRISAIELEYKNKTKFFEDLIKGYLGNVDMRVTATKKTYRLPSATLTVKVPGKTIVFDNDKLFEFVKNNMPHYLKVKTTESVDWANLKASCEKTQDGFEHVTSDGELIKVEGAYLVDDPEDQPVKIKFEGGGTYETQTDNDD